jgi:hypothetical protein
MKVINLLIKVLILDSVANNILDKVYSNTVAPDKPKMSGIFLYRIGLPNTYLRKIYDKQIIGRSYKNTSTRFRNK